MKVSIIVPIYNCEKTLKICVDSILKQTYKNIEVILVDDGSSDSSYDICKKFESIDQRINVFRQENDGASSARNLGILHSNGKYIMFVDADDYIENNMLQTLIDKAETENADFVMCGMTLDTYNSNGDLISSKECSLVPRTISGNNNIPSNIIDLVENEKINGPCSKLIKKSIIKDNQIIMPEHITLQEDLYFNLKILEKIEKMVVIEGCYYHYVKRQFESATTKYFLNRFEMTNEVHDLLLKYYYKRCDNQNIINLVKYIYIKNTFAGIINLFHKNCKLSKNEKLIYIRSIIDSNKYNEMISTAFKPGLKYKILISLLRSKSTILIYYTSRCFFVMKHSFGLGY